MEILKHCMSALMRYLLAVYRSLLGWLSWNLLLILVVLNFTLDSFEGVDINCQDPTFQHYIKDIIYNYTGTKHINNGGPKLSCVSHLADY